MIISSSPYGDERIWNALRLVEALCCIGAKMKINIFLIGDAVNAAKKGQKPPRGFYNIEKMLADLVKAGVNACVCHTSMNLRGLTVERTRSKEQRWVQSQSCPTGYSNHKKSYPSRALACARGFGA